LLGIKKVSELPASQYVYFLTSRTIWDGDIYFVANALLVQPSPFNLLMQPVLKSDLPSIHVDIQAEMVEEGVAEEEEAAAEELARNRRRRSADDADSTRRKEGTKGKKGRRLKNIVFIRTFSSYDLHRGDDIDSFSGDGGWLHLDASLTVRVDLEKREHSRHLKVLHALCPIHYDCLCGGIACTIPYTLCSLYTLLTTHSTPCTHVT
jgi:hypothetical protein